jgi:hypothetical protein
VTAQVEKAKGTVRTVPPVEGGGRGNPAPDAFSAFECTTHGKILHMTDYKGVLDDLKAKRAALREEYEALDTAITAIERLLAASTRAGRAGTPPLEPKSISPRAFVGLTMPQAVLKFLRQAQEPQAKPQIKAAIVAGGMRGGTNIGSHIYNTLHRLSQNNGPIRREPDGRWSLRERSASGSETGQTTLLDQSTH